MSRTKMFFTLFLVFLLGMLGSVFLFQNWLDTYHQKVIKPSMEGKLKAARGAIELLALRKLNTLQRSISSKKLLRAFASSKTEHFEKFATDFRTSFFPSSHAIVALNKKGTVTAAVGRIKDSWKGKKCDSDPFVISALAGTAAFGEKTVKGHAFLILSLPVKGHSFARPKAAPSTKEENSTQTTKTPTPKKKKIVHQKAKKKQCPKGRIWACLNICWKRDKKRRCIQRKRHCACYRKRSRKKRRKKKHSALPILHKVRLAQAAHDDKALKKDPHVKGVLLVIYDMDHLFASELKKIVSTNVAFFIKKGQIVGSTFAKDFDENLTKALAKKKISELTGNLFHLQVGQKYYAFLGSKLSNDIGFFVFFDTNSIRDILQQQIIFLAAIALAVFLLLLILLLPAAGKPLKQIEEIEEKVLQIYQSGDFTITFEEKYAAPIGSLGRALNHLFRQLRETAEQVERETAEWVEEQTSLVKAAQEQAFSVAASASATPSQPTEEPPAAPSQPTEEPPANETTTDATNNDELSLQEALLQSPEEHYAAVFEKYVAAKKEVGEDTSKLKLERFTQKLRKNAATYMEKYDCKGVLFDVSIKDGKVILKPQLIPKD